MTPPETALDDTTTSNSSTSGVRWGRMLQWVSGIIIFLVLADHTVTALALWFGGLLAGMGVWGRLADGHRDKKELAKDRLAVAETMETAYSDVIERHSLEDEASRAIETRRQELEKQQEWAERDPVAHEVLTEDGDDAETDSNTDSDETRP